MVNGGSESNFTGNLELTRMMIALRYLDSNISIEEVWLLAEVSNLGIIEEDEAQIKQKYITFQPFIRSLRRSIPELNYLFQERTHNLIKTG